MSEQSLKSGSCPRCGGNEVYNDEGMNKHNQRGIINVAFMSGFQITTFICVNCGFLDEYIGEAYIKNGTLTEALRKNWKKT